MKKAISLALALLLALSLLPLSALAAGSTKLETDYFPSGISAPKAPYLRYDGVDTDHGDFIYMWYNLPPELLALADAYSRWYESDTGNDGFKAQFGVNDYSIKIETDAKIDGGAWQYTSAWDDPDWSGLDEPSYLAFQCHEYVSQDTRKLYENTTLSWLVYLEEGRLGFLAPIVTPFAMDNGDTNYNYDLAGHTLTVRTRFAVRLDTGDGAKMVFSPWSPETSIGKGGTQKTLAKPSSLAAPKLSDFSMVVNEEGSRNGKYYLDVPDSVFDALLYCEAQEDMFEPIVIDAQMRVNGGAWEDVYTANPCWIFSNYRVAAPDGGLKASDSVEIRVRFVCDQLGLTSAWSNTVGTTAFNASSWAQAELADAAALGLIPDSLKGADLTRPITRAEFAAVSVRVFESLTGTKAQPVAENPFTDTKDPEVLKAYNVGVTNGTAVGRFSPDVLLNRETLATMLTRVYKKVAISGWTLEADGSFNTQFKAMYEMPELFADDQDISGWARDSVYFMYANKLVGGVGNNKFAPKNVTSAQEAANYAVATREQALLMAVRMVKNLG